MDLLSALHNLYRARVFVWFSVPPTKKTLAWTHRPIHKNISQQVSTLKNYPHNSKACASRQLVMQLAKIA
jgi:hypothetical protein